MKARVEQLLGILRENPWQNPPPYEKLKGDLAGMYSRRINVQHRLDLNGAESCGTARYGPARSCRKRIGGRNNCVQFGHKKISRPTGG